MNTLIIIGAIAACGIILGLFLRRPSDDKDKYLMLQEALNATAKNLADQMNNMRRSLDAQSSEVGKRLDNSAKVFAGFTEKMGKVEETIKNVADIGKDISGLHDILRAPKLRGGLGEFLLGDLLSQYFPKDKFSMPYTFRSGDKVDAALHLADNFIVPIDSKFPLENFKKLMDTKDDRERKLHKKAFVSDVKRRIDEIAKYILPDEGTVEFALLYIPAENVYYEVIIKDEGDDSLSAYAFKKRVIPVSPNNFFVYLQTVLMGLKGLQIEQSAKRIMDALVRLKGDFAKFGEDYDVLGSHLTNASNKFDESKRRMERIGQKIENIELLREEDKKKVLKAG